MQKISEFMRKEAQLLSDELVELNTEQFLRDSISGFGMRTKVIELLGYLRAALFPSLYETDIVNTEFLNSKVLDRINNAAMLLHEIIFEVMTKMCEHRGECECEDCVNKAESITLEFMRQLAGIRVKLVTDIKAAYLGDPAARHMEEILLSYPSIEAVTIYRIANKLSTLGVPLIPRVMTEYAHQITGIDIHPGATIGEYFFIDHGTGVVIGETCVIGNNVKLYQGVTLGAKSFLLDDSGNPVKGIKRHPNIEDDVIIYSGATILGGDTTIGKGSIIGGNVWLVGSVPPYSKVYNSTPDPVVK